ncbi:MAG: hypothetical protein H6862_02700 [Rhodospirillales bacterium]|nr:hypothetical protein [Rhodospirillales bacterium]
MSIDLVKCLEKQAIEPHRPLLKQPPDDQLLYKYVKLDYFEDMLKHGYLYFNRVDSYKDSCDGDQLRLDREQNQRVGFFKSPESTAENCYDRCRSRTYACCFSLEHSSHIYNAYGRDAVCLVFHFGKLREMLNQTIGALKWQYGNGSSPASSGVFPNIFFINYGIVEYTDFSEDRLNTEYLPNPIQYTYLKDKKFEAEQELRISLSTLGIPSPVIGDSPMIFPKSFCLEFSFREAVSSGVITHMECEGPNDFSKIEKSLRACNIDVRL